MKGRNFSIRIQRVKYVITDFVMTEIAFCLFNIIRFHVLGLVNSGYGTTIDFMTSDKLILEEIFVPLSMLGIYWLSGYYNQPFVKSRLSELNDTLMSALVSTILIFFILLINDTTGIKIKDYELILALFGVLFIFTYTGRRILTMRTAGHLRRRRWIFSTLIIGNSPKSRDIYRKLKQSGSIWTYDVVGFIRLDREHDVSDGMPTWNMDEIDEVCRRYKIDQIVIAPERNRDAYIMSILERLFPLELPVKIAPDTLSYITGNIRLDDILGIPFIDLTSPRISEFQKNVKRTFDVTVSALSLIALSPFLALTACIVKHTSKGPVIYSQERIGKKRKPFNIYKFRSMRENAEEQGPQLSSEHDSRITPFGRFMRKYRVDELPQFWNVLKGDMSLVGPRPERAYFIERIIKKAPYYGLVFQVRPGITGWGMVKYGYASTIDEMVKRSRYDLLYLNNMSISTDMKILIHTVNTVLEGAGK